MPSGHSVRLDDDEDVLPSRPGPRQQNPEASVSRCEPRAASLLGEVRELLTKGEFNDRLLASASKECGDAPKGDRDEIQQLPHSKAYSAACLEGIRD